MQKGMMNKMIASILMNISKGAGPMFGPGEKKSSKPVNTHPMITSSDLDIARHNALVVQRKAQHHGDRMAKALAARNAAR